MILRSRTVLPVLLLLSLAGTARAQKKPAKPLDAPTAVPPGSKPKRVHDRRYGVRFRVPAGWSFTRRDGRVSTFHLDARTAPRQAVLRGVANIDFNPFPTTTFEGAVFYFSVAPRSSDVECARQAVTRTAAVTARPNLRSTEQKTSDTQSIGGMSFAHGHDERGHLCVEQRDEIYTAYRKGACYRFDLAVNTFCGVSSGIDDLSDPEVEQIDAQMAEILSTVALAWSKAGPQQVAAPRLPKLPKPASPPKPPPPQVSGQ